MNNNSDLAILLATYNGEKYLREQLDSILSQTFKNWELYIHDDASSDSTPAIISDYASLFPQKIHVLNSPATGSAKDNFMFLMNNIDSPYIAFCDQDDYWHPDKLEKSLSEMHDVENELGADIPVLVFSELSVVDEHLQPICDTLSAFQNLDCTRTNFEKLLLQNVATGCTVVINRALLTLARTENTSGIVMHDWWCALVASRFGVISFISEPLVDYRQHSSNSVGALDVNSASYAKKKLSDTSRIQKDLSDTRLQAKCFADKFNDTFSESYSSLGEKSKLSRINFYLKNDMWKKGLLRNLSLILYG